MYAMSIATQTLTLALIGGGEEGVPISTLLEIDSIDLFLTGNPNLTVTLTTALRP